MGRQDQRRSVASGGFPTRHTIPPSHHRVALPHQRPVSRPTRQSESEREGVDANLRGGGEEEEEEEGGVEQVAEAEAGAGCHQGGNDPTIKTHQLCQERERDGERARTRREEGAGKRTSHSSPRLVHFA